MQVKADNNPSNKNNMDHNENKKTQVVKHPNHDTTLYLKWSESFKKLVNYNNNKLL